MAKNLIICNKSEHSLPDDVCGDKHKRWYLFLDKLINYIDNNYNDVSYDSYDPGSLMTWTLSL